MTTTVTSSIGTSSRNYSTAQAWEDAAPANLVTADEVWRGECYNDSEFTGTSSTILTIQSSTSDATRYKELACATGQSFSDNASVQSNALKYNVSNGVGFRCTTTAYGDPVIALRENYARITGIQVKCDSVSGGGLTQAADQPIGQIIDRCLCEGQRSAVGGASGTLSLYGDNTVKNTLVIKRSGGGTIVGLANGAKAYFCTFVIPSDLSAGTGINSTYLDPTVQNCAIFGCSAVQTGGNTGISHCYTDVAGNPDNCTTVTYANQFQNTTNASGDWRLKTGADLIDAGTTDSTNGAKDIAGTSRPSGSAYDVGCWEFVAAAAASTYLDRHFPRGVGRGIARGVA